MKKEAEPFAEDAKIEMGELIESDQEMYHCDVEGRDIRKHRNGKQSQDLTSAEDLQGAAWDQLFDSDSDRSFMDPDEQDTIVKAHKKKDVKLNNSFTGPYP